MVHLTVLDPEWRDILERHVDSAKPDALGNCDNVALAQGSWVVLLADTPRAAKPPEVLKKFFKRIKKDYAGTIRRAKALYNDLLSSVKLINGEVVVESLHNRFGWFPIFREYAEWYRTGDDSLLFYIGTFLCWAKKAEYLNPDLRDEALAKWTATENDLCKVDPPKKILEDLKFFLSYLPAPNIEDLNMKFGPGKVADKDVEDYEQKLDTRYHPGVDYLLDWVAGDAPGLRYVIPNPKLWSLGSHEAALQSPLESEWDAVSKDIDGLRTICKEPNSQMYGQQGVAAMLLAAISRSPYRTAINIHDQSRNANAAMEASKTLLYDTIDLKDASDRMLNRVIKAVMPPLWNNLFQALRSKKVVLPNGRSRTIEKHAPMGSALCFPIQSLVFSAIACLARFIADEGCTFESYLNNDLMPYRLVVDSGLRVYGDDIIIHRRETTIMISLLESLGFKVNQQKSFFAPRMFRESCGTYAMRGNDITPLMFKGKGLATQDLQYIEGLISLCNRLYERGLYSTHAYLSGYIPRQFYVEVSEGENRLPYHLLSIDPDNSKLKKRYNTQLQRTEYRVKIYGSVNAPVDSPEDTFYRLARFYMDPSTTEGRKPQTGNALSMAVTRNWVAG